MDKISNKKKITVTSICGVIFLIVTLIVSATLFNKGKDPVGKTTAYLTSEGNFQSNISIEGVKLRVYQNTGDGYKNVTKDGFDQVYQYFSTDKTYNYDLIIKNDESADVTADQYYLRWYFTATIDGAEYDISEFCNVDTAFVNKQEDSDGKTRFYSVNAGASNIIGVQNQLALLSNIGFDGEFDTETKTYASVLDKEFSGSRVKITIHIEGSLTPYDIVSQSIKIYGNNGNIIQEISLEEGQTSISMPSAVPQASITQNGTTLYFQGWTKNGVVSQVYTINEDVEVSGDEVFTPYYAEDPDYSDFVFTVDSVTGEYMIAGANKNMTSATIPALTQGQVVSVVKNDAFSSYSSLQTVTMPQTVTKIGDYAFSYCTNLTSITIPNSVTSIGVNAFGNCTSLTSITIPNSVTSIWVNAFSNCTSLTSINVDNNNTTYSSIDGVVCNKNQSTLILYPEGRQGAYTIPNSVTSIGNMAFYNCSGLTSITIPNSVTSIGDCAFQYCSNLTSVTIGNGVTSIGESAFYCSGLTSIDIPNSVTSIGSGAFGGCTNLTSIDIPDSVTSIRSLAFWGCTGLTSITIPNSVTSIGDGAFCDCPNLTSIDIPDSVTSIGDSAFNHCKSLTSITIPNSVTSIGSGAFGGCTNLTSITIPNSVTSIGNMAFYDCSGLTSITIPNSVTSIGHYAFSGCSALTRVTFSNTSGWYATSSSSFTGGSRITVTNASTNATNLKSGSWYDKYLYRT